jgi:hypothetical protein
VYAVIQRHGSNSLTSSGKLNAASDGHLIYTRGVRRNTLWLHFCKSKAQEKAENSIKQKHKSLIPVNQQLHSETFLRKTQNTSRLYMQNSYSNNLSIPSLPTLKPLSQKPTLQQLHQS